MEEFGKAITGLSASIFSPAKMVYLGFFVLVYLRVPTQTWFVFLAISVIFLVAEIGHNDWLRLRLNFYGDKPKLEWQRRHFTCPECKHKFSSLESQAE